MSEGKQGEGGRLLSPRKSSEKAPDSEVVTYSRKRKAGADEAADAKPVKKEADDEPRKPEDDWPVSAYGSGREAARLAMQRVRQQASSKKGKKPAGKQPAGGAADLQARFSGAATDSGGEDGVPAKEEPEGDSSVLPKVGAEERVGKGAPAVGEEPEGGRRTRASMAAGALQTKGKVGKGQKKAEQEKTQPPGKDGKAGEQSSPGGGTIGRSLSPRLALKRCEDAKSPKASGGMTPRLAARRGEVEDGAAPAEGGKQAKVEEESRQSAEESGALAGGAVVKNGKSAIESKGRPESADEKRETRQRGRPKLDTGEVVFEREIATPRQSARGKPAEGLRISPRGKKESKAVAVQTAAVVEIEKKKPKKEEEKEETIVLDTEIPAEAVGASESGKEKQEGGVDVTQGAEVLRKVVEAEGNGTEGGEKKKDEGAGKEGKDGKEVEAALALLEAIGKELGPEQEESSELGTSQKDAAGGPDEGKADAAVGPNIEKVDEETGPKAEAPMATTAEEAGSAAVRTEELVTEIPSVSESAAVQESPAPEEEGKGAGDLPPPVRLTRQQLRERKEVGGTGGAKPKEPSTEVGIAEEKIPEGEGLETQAEPKERGEGAEAVLELGSGLVGVVKAEEVSGSEATPAEKDGQGAETESPVDAAKEKVEDEEKEKVPVPVVKAAPLNPATCPICLKTFKSPKAMYGHQRTHDTGQRSRVENPKVGVKRKESAAGAPVAKAPKKAASEGAGEKAVGKGDAASKLEVKKEAGAVAKKLGETPPTRVLKKRRVTEVAVEKKQHESVEGQTVKKLQGFTGAPKPGEAKPGEAKPGVKPGVKLGVKPGLKPGVAKPGDGKLGEGKPGGKPGVKPGVKLVKKLPVPEAKGSAGGEATCPICQRTFHSNKAMYGHQRAHNSAKGVSAAPKITPAKSPETKKLKKVSLGKVPEGAPLLKKKSTLGKASASGQLKKLAAVLQKLKKGPVGKGLVKSSGVPAKLKPKQESLAGAETPASPATCPICLRTFQSPKAMYGHQRTHDLDERSRLSGVGLPPVKVKEGLPVRKLKPPGLLGKKKKLSAVAVAPGVLIRKKPPGGPSGPSVVLAWNKKAAAQSVLLAQKKKRSEPAPTFKPTVVHTESQEEGAEEEGDGRASLDGAESPAHTPGSVPTCPVCQRTFKSRKALYGHQRTHGGGFAVAVQKKLRLGRPPSASGMMKKKSLGSEGSEGEQSRFDRLRSRVRGEGSLADVSEEGERRSGRLPVFEALGGSDNQGVVAGPRTIPHSELRGGRMQGAVCHQGRTPLPRVRTVITPDDVLADSGGYSIKGVMQNPTAGSLVGSCLECRGGVFSEGRAWLRCGGGCGRYIHQKCTARPRMKGPPGEGYIYACWECRECHSCGVRLLDAPEPGQHKERQYTLCPPCARLWAMHNYCTACEKVRVKFGLWPFERIWAASSPLLLLRPICESAAVVSDLQKLLFSL